MVVVLVHGAYTNCASNRSKLGWHRILADKYRIFSAISPGIKTIMVEAVTFTLIISGSVLIRNIAIHSRVRQNLHILIVKLRGNEV